MYLLDWKVPKRLERPRDLLYEHYIQTTQEQHTTTKRTTYTRAIGCFVYNAAYHVSGGVTDIEVTLRKESFSQPLIYNCNRVNRKVSYRATKAVFDWMVSEGLVELSVGSVDTWKVVSGRVAPSTCKSSVISISQELVELIEPVSSKGQFKELNVLEYRDNDGVPQTKRLKEPQKKLIALLNTYNQYMKRCDISLNGKTYNIAGKKVFNNGWDLGGRTYLCGTGIMSELMKKNARGGILINGEKTIAWDYSALHPRMIAEMEGVTLPEDFDPYGIQLEGYDKDCLRSIAKLGMLITINSDSLRTAIYALSAECYANLPLNDWKANNMIPDPLGAKLVIDAIIEHNGYAKDWFLEKKGLLLQGLDSKMIDIVIQHFLERGVITIPLHDSVIIDNKYIDELKDVMYNAYETVLGSKNNCKLKLED